MIHLPRLLLAVLLGAAVLVPTAFADPVPTPLGPAPTEGALLSFHFQDTPVADALATIARAGGINLLMGAGVKGNVKNVEVKDVSAEQALTAVAQAAGMTLSKRGNAYVIDAPAAEAAPIPRPTPTPRLLSPPRPEPPEYGPSVILPPPGLQYMPPVIPAPPLGEVSPWLPPAHPSSGAAVLVPLAASADPVAPTRADCLVIESLPLKYVSAAETATAYFGDTPVPSVQLPEVLAPRVSRLLNEAFLGITLPATGDPGAGLKNQLTFNAVPVGNYGPARSRGEDMKSFLPADVRIMADETGNTLLVSGPPEGVLQFREVLTLLDQPRREITVCVNLVEILLAEGEPEVPGAVGLAPPKLAATLRTQLNKGIARQLGSGKYMVNNNRTLTTLWGSLYRGYASRAGDRGERLWEPRAGFAGVSLCLTPLIISADDSVTLTVDTSRVGTGQPCAPPVRLNPGDLQISDPLTSQVTAKSKEWLVVGFPGVTIASLEGLAGGPAPAPPTAGGPAPASTPARSELVAVITVTPAAYRTIPAR
ncbi:MAG TPA: secretin N-terminal domain-containing protein [Armatimonadota bacterium]|jgi:hypothetical protein